MYDPSNPQQQFQKHLKDQREHAAYDDWVKRQGGKPQTNPVENAIAWIVFIGVALLIIIFLTQAFGS